MSYMKMIPPPLFTNLANQHSGGSKFFLNRWAQPLEKGVRHGPVIIFEHFLTTFPNSNF